MLTLWESKATDEIVDQPHLIIDEHNWLNYRGCDNGLSGLGVHLNFKPVARSPLAIYLALFLSHRLQQVERFFALQIDLKGSQAVMLQYLPLLVTGGAAADFFHPLIELGYYFESGLQEPAVLAASLAWLTVAHVPIHSQGKQAVFKCPQKAMQALASTEYSFPKFDRDRYFSSGCSVSRPSN